MWVPNWWLKMSMQELPHDGVAADAPPAVSAPATPTPPTRVSVAAAASTLLLMDINSSSLGTHSHALRTAVSSWPPQRTSDVSPIARHAAGSRWPDRDQNAALTGLAVRRGKDPGTPGGLRGTGLLTLPTRIDAQRVQMVDAQVY